MRRAISWASRIIRMSRAHCAHSWRVPPWPEASRYQKDSSDAPQAAFNRGLKFLELFDMEGRTARAKHQGARDDRPEQRTEFAQKSLRLPIRQQPVRRGGANGNQRRRCGGDFAPHLEHAA